MSDKDVQRYSTVDLVAWPVGKPDQEFVKADAYDAIVREVEALKAQANKMAWLLIECRDALPAITVVSTRVHHAYWSLATRIESVLEPLLSDDDPRGI